MATPAADRLVADRYALKASIGRGGMGVVWRARDTVLGREVAVKEVVFPPTMPEEERRPAQARVMREARAAARLNHPAAVVLYDVVRRDGPLPVERAAEIGAQVASALEAAHQAGIVHRDVKPGNVMVPANGMAKLADFGIASLQGDPQLTSTGLVIGSPAYMAPEQAKGEGSGPPADFWALGGTIFYAVEGEPPFDRGTSIATLAAVVNEPPRPPRRAGPLAPLLTALLAKDPAARPSGPELRAELARVAAVRPAPPTEVLPVQGPGRSVPLADPEPEPPEPGDPTPVPPVTAEEAPSAAEAPAPAAAAVPPAPADEPPGPGTDREVATAGDPAATQRPARPLLPPAPPASRRGRAVGLLVLLAVVAVAAVLIAANLRSDGDGDPSAAPRTTAAGTRPSETTGQGSSTTAASQTTAAPTTTAAGGQLPEGWTAFTNQRGSNRVGVPPGWEARTRNSFNATVVQEQQASERVFTVRSTNPANPLPQASRAYRAWAPQNFEDFREVRYEENQTYAGRPGAVVFEYEARRDGRQVHVSHINLKGRTWGYNVELIVPAELWGDSQDLARQFERAFQPLG